jgi:hypothetical protein
MSAPVYRASLCRIAELDGLDWAPVERARWATGDFVVGEVVHPGAPSARIELCSGRMIGVGVGDLVVGAFGVRHATLEATGTWRSIGSDDEFDAMTGAGLFGQVTSISPFLPRPIRLAYRGHVLDNNHKVTMRTTVPTVTERPFVIPTVLIVGSSMSAGKTATGRVVVRRLKQMGLDVVAAKVTGAGRYRDVLTLGDAGADWIYDFVDVGLPSTICPPDRYRELATELLSRMAQHPADVAVIEAGASPLEPYNGAVATELLDGAVRLTLLCASDPYSVLGIQQAFDQRIDLVAGIATNTDAGVELIERLTGLPSLRLPDREALPVLDQYLKSALGLSP